jgi:Amt family ammonium transporter
MPEINAGDTAWVLVSAALVMLMTPGLALFYGGLVRRKNVLSTIMHSFFILGLVSVTWVLWGYTLAFGPDTGLGLIGGFEWLGLEGVTGEPSDVYATTVPHLAFMAFQMMFAIITPALITGAFAERKRFKAFIVFAVAWSTLVYAPVAHWVWSPDGWLFGLGVLDFAGGTVVHLSSGIAALVAALFIGRRTGLVEPATEPHDVPMTVLGAGLLWFGWFGFNAGSALGATQLAAPRVAVSPRRRDRRGGRTRGHHARRRVRDAGRLDPHRLRRRHRLLRRRAPAAPRPDRRCPRRLQRPRRRRRVRRHRHRRLRHDRGQRRRLRRPPGR